MITESQHRTIIESIQSSPLSGAPLRRLAMEALAALDDYQWSGIYRLEGDELVLDEYVGDATDHTRIPVGRGVCGSAVAEDKNQLVDDVRELSNYLACSLKTRSEIVVLIRSSEGPVLGQIDIDGHRVKAFDASDEALLEELASLLAARWS